MKLQQSQLSSSGENEEVYPYNNFFQSKYWQHFPRVGLSPSSLLEVAISIIGIALIAFVYSFIYIGFVIVKRIVQSIKDFFAHKATYTTR